MASIRFALRRDSPALCPVEATAHAHDRRALLHGYREVLRGAHREPRQPVRIGELAEGGEVAPTVLGVLGERRHRHQPADAYGGALEEGAELRGRDAGLALLARHVDLDEDLGVARAVALELSQRRVRGDGVDQLGVREDLLDLAALELADEVPAEAGVLAVLGLEVLRAVLPEQGQAGLGEHADLVERDVLHRGEQFHLGRVAPRAARRVGDLLANARGRRAHRAGLEYGDQARHTTPAWRPVTPPSRRWEKNSPNQHIVQRPTSWTSSTPASASWAVATLARSRLRSPTRAS